MKNKEAKPKRWFTAWSLEWKFLVLSNTCPIRMRIH